MSGSGGSSSGNSASAAGSEASPPDGGQTSSDGDGADATVDASSDASLDADIGDGAPADSGGGGAACPSGGSVEVCNGVDDDLDGLVDEPSSQNTAVCNSCTAFDRDGFAYWFCTDNRDWSPSQNDCQAKGGNLASIHDMAENDFIASTMVSLGINGRMWMGMNDRDSEGNYAWLDGTPFDYSWINCSTARPSQGNEDCGNFSSSAGCWDDDDCSGHDFPRLCKAPHVASCE